MNIEKALAEKIGAAGEKLHTARSRNDQINLDVRLYLRDEIEQKGDLSSAILRLHEIVQTPEGRKTVHLRRLVSLYQQSGRLREALEQVNEWKKTAPGDQQAWITRANLLTESGRLNDAVAEHRRLIGKFGPNAEHRERLAEVLQKSGDAQSAEKIYHAVVEGCPPEAEGTINNYLCENRAKIVYVCDKHVKGSQQATTHYKILRGEGGRRILEVKIETGRKHQIRVHMAVTLECPIVGDDIYGLGKSGTRGIALHSHSLSFDHPVTGKRVTVKSPMPTRFRGLV